MGTSSSDFDIDGRKIAASISLMPLKCDNISNNDI